MVNKLLGLESGQAIILPVQETVLAAKTTTYLMSVVAVFRYGTLLCFGWIGDGSWILLPVGTWTCFLFSTGLSYIHLGFDSE